MGFTESWLHSNIADLMLVKKGFNIERQDRANDRHGGGLCCYIKDSIEYTHYVYYFKKKPSKDI